MKGERSMQNEWIVISEYCDKCHIEPTFNYCCAKVG